LTVFTYPGKTGIPVNKEVIIASGTSSTPVTGTSLNLASHIIPAHSTGLDGYLILDIFVTRTGTASNILILLFLDGLGFYTDTMTTADASLQTRFILYADHSTTTMKEESAQSTHNTPYYKGPFSTPVSIDVDTETDYDLSIGAVVFDTSDSFTLEGYSIRTFNPSNSNTITKGRL